MAEHTPEFEAVLDRADKIVQEALSNLSDDITALTREVTGYGPEEVDSLTGATFVEVLHQIIDIHGSVGVALRNESDFLLDMASVGSSALSLAREELAEKAPLN